jgi:hypothetical protein
LKACPCFRNFVHNNLRNRTWKFDIPVISLFQDRLFYAFWESFLSNDLRDGQQPRTEARQKQQKSQFGFDGEKNYNNTRFAILDFPWDAPIFGFTERYTIGRTNEMLDIHDIVGVLDKTMVLTESQVFVTVSHDEDNASPSCFGQENGPFIRVNPLFPSDREDKLYAQVDEKGSITKNRVTIADKYYRIDMQEVLQLMSDRLEFKIDDLGEILIIEVQVRMARTAFLFLENGPNAVSEAYITDVINTQHGFRVFSKMQAPPSLFIQNKLFVLTSIINNEAKNHYTAHTNGDHNQQWWHFDDEKLNAIRSKHMLQQTRGLADPNSVCFFYQKVRLPTIPTLEQLRILKLKLEPLVANSARIRADNERCNRILLHYKDTRIIKCLGIETDSSSSSSPVNLDVIDGIITEAGHGIHPGSTNNKRIVTSRSSSSS